MEVEALADTGAMHMILPPWVASELELDESDRRTAVVADGRRQIASYQGPLLVTFRDRHSITGAMVTGDQVLLGAIAMEDMDLAVSPLRQTVDYHPDSDGGLARARV